MPPPFEPTEIEAVAITNIGLMFSHYLTLIIMVILIIYCYKNIKDYLPIIVVYMFSILFGMEGLSHTHLQTGYSPLLEVFFMVFQSSIFIIASIDYYTTYKKRKGIK